MKMYLCTALYNVANKGAAMNDASVNLDFRAVSVFDSVEEPFVFRHVSLPIEQLLTTALDAQLEYMFQRPVDEIKLDLQARQNCGEKLITTEICDNFCPVLGCQGHSL
jgi:hypothetical protein